MTLLSISSPRTSSSTRRGLKAAKASDRPSRRSTTTSTTRRQRSTASWPRTTSSSCSSRCTGAMWPRQCRCSPICLRPGTPSRGTSSTSGGLRTVPSSSTGPAVMMSDFLHRSEAGRSRNDRGVRMLLRVRVSPARQRNCSCHSVPGCGLNRRTSWGQPQASAILPAHILAASSSATSTTVRPPRNSLVST